MTCTKNKTKKIKHQMLLLILFFTNKEALSCFAWKLSSRLATRTWTSTENSDLFIYYCELHVFSGPYAPWSQNSKQVCLAGGVWEIRCVSEKNYYKWRTRWCYQGKSNIFMLSPESMLFCVISSTLLFLSFLLFLISTSLGRRKLESK